MVVAGSGEGEAFETTARDGTRAGLLFDLDGTLVQTEHLHFAAFQAIVAKSGRPFTEADFVQHVSGRSNAAIMNFLFPGGSAVEHARLAEEKEASFRALASAAGVDAMPGAVALIDWARRHDVATGLVTNAPRANAELMVSLLGLRDAFDTVLTSNEVERSKPHPDPYLAAVRRLRLAPPRTVVIEDSLPGLAAARAAGLFVVALAVPSTLEAVRTSGADLVVTTLADPVLIEALERTCGVR